VLEKGGREGGEGGEGGCEWSKRVRMLILYECTNACRLEHIYFVNELFLILPFLSFVPF